MSNTQHETHETAKASPKSSNGHNKSAEPSILQEAAVGLFDTVKRATHSILHLGDKLAESTATGLLEDQHTEVKALFAQLEKGHANPRSVMTKLADSLAAHMVIEQEIFYPAVIAASPDLVRESYEEHAIARFALKRLMSTRPTDPSFKARVTALRELIEHHVDEEEDDLFPKAEKALGDESPKVYAHMKSVFDQKVKLGFAKLVGKGGDAVRSAKPPQPKASSKKTRQQTKTAISG